MTDTVLSLPPVADNDNDEVALALQTAHALWRRDDHHEAVRWLRRAAATASECGDDMRSVVLATSAADLTSELGIPRSVAPAAPAANGSGDLHGGAPNGAPGAGASANGADGAQAPPNWAGPNESSQGPISVPPGSSPYTAEPGTPGTSETTLVGDGFLHGDTPDVASPNPGSVRVPAAGPTLPMTTLPLTAPSVDAAAGSAPSDFPPLVAPAGPPPAPPFVAPEGQAYAPIGQIAAAAAPAGFTEQPRAPVAPAQAQGAPRATAAQTPTVQATPAALATRPAAAPVPVVQRPAVAAAPAAPVAFVPTTATPVAGTPTAAIASPAAHPATARGPAPEPATHQALRVVVYPSNGDVRLLTARVLAVGETAPANAFEALLVSLKPGERLI